MACLNLDPGYPTHIKTLRLIALLGHDADALPVRLGLHCGMHHPETGELEGYTPREIESIIRWRGKRGAAVRALLKTGFLDRFPKGYRVHNWLRHQGHLAVLKRRSVKANEARWRRIEGDDAHQPAGEANDRQYGDKIRYVAGSAGKSGSARLESHQKNSYLTWDG